MAHDHIVQIDTSEGAAMTLDQIHGLIGRMMNETHDPAAIVALNDALGSISEAILAFMSNDS